MVELLLRKEFYGMLHKVSEKTLTLKDYLKVTEAAKVLGVHPDTLRRWENLNAVPVRRHPINHYRLYRRSDLEQVLKSVGSE